MDADDGRIVARLRLPLRVSGFDRLGSALEAVYGEGLLLRQDGDWLTVLTPEPEGA